MGHGFQQVKYAQKACLKVFQVLHQAATPRSFMPLTSTVHWLHLTEARDCFDHIVRLIIEAL